MPTASVGAPPVRDRIVFSPTSDATLVNVSGVIANPQAEIAEAAASGVAPIIAGALPEKQQLHLIGALTGEEHLFLRYRVD